MDAFWQYIDSVASHLGNGPAVLPQSYCIYLLFIQMLSFASHDLGLEFQASFFTLLFYSSKVKVKFVQLYLTLWHPMDCNPSGSSVHGIFQASILEWVVIPSLLYANRVVSSAYLRLLTFLPTILIPACASSSPAFHRMYFAYKLNKQGDNTHT